MINQLIYWRKWNQQNEWEESFNQVPKTKLKKSREGLKQLKRVWERIMAREFIRNTYPFIISQSLHQLRHEKCNLFRRIRFQYPKNICHNTWMPLVSRSEELKSLCNWTSSPMWQLSQKFRIFINSFWRDKIRQSFRNGANIQYVQLQ